MMSNHPYPSILRAYQWSQVDRVLKSDWECLISIELELMSARLNEPVKTLHPNHLERLSYYWLLENNYHELKTI